MIIIKPSLRSHTHWQVAQKADTQAKTCQRVCLPERTTDLQPVDRKEQRRHNITYTQAGVSCFVGQESAKFKVRFFVGSSVVKIPACV